ncbi:MAG TPA: hypothetical protein VKX45_00010 [Bryobacteraceae bacterium]|jgi:hypothetical protein|nr:hypothetical protein [Bryobacteraceae bacterium]
MNNEITKPPSNEIEVARMLGARHAFGLVAGRCSAADAAILRDIRDNKKFLSFAPTWDEFCEKHAHLSKSHANRLIRYLNELGPAYFTLAQLTRITPEEFRALAPSVKDNALEFRGEAIALIEENAGRLTEAVGVLRQPAAPEASTAEPYRKKLERIEATVRKSLQALVPLLHDQQAGRCAVGTLDRIGRAVGKFQYDWPSMR